jgi:hypothetical protein
MRTRHPDQPHLTWSARNRQIFHAHISSLPCCPSTPTQLMSNSEYRSHPGRSRIWIDSIGRAKHPSPDTCTPPINRPLRTKLPHKHLARETDNMRDLQSPRLIASLPKFSTSTSTPRVFPSLLKGTTARLNSMGETRAATRLLRETRG